MSYSISQLQTDLAGILHGQSTNAIFNLSGVINRAARQLILDCDPMETKRYAPVSGTVFNGVYDYSVPVDLKGNKVIDLLPQVNRCSSEVWLQAYNQAFDIRKGQPWSSDMFTINFNTGLKSIRINAPFFPPPIIIDPLNSLTGSATYTTAGGATTPVIDNINYAYGSGSLEFNLAAGQSTGGIAATLVSPVNLQADLNQGTLFLWVYIPAPASMTSVTLQFGSSVSNYYQVSTSVTQQNTAFIAGWNLLAFPWLGATVVGTPNPASILNYNVSFAYDSTLQTAVRINYLNSNLGSILNMEYYSKYLFRTSAGTWIENTTQSTDLINLDTDSYNLMTYLCAYIVVQQQQGLDALFFDANFFLQRYNDALAQYKAQYKSEIQLPQNTYYRPKRGGYSWYSGRWSNT